jgi:hypothetical protein
MAQEPTTAANIKAALEMVDLFASVGVERFELTHTNIDQVLRGCRHGQTVNQVKTSLPYLIPSSFTRQNNVILRPHNSARAAYIQLDDLAAVALDKIKPAAFMVIETSPGNYQVWLAVVGAGKDEARRLRKGLNADDTASGATRVAGSRNHKHKYAPAFPVVTVIYAQPGRIATMPELEALDVVAPADPPSPPPVLPKSAGTGRWPDYARCLANAPPAMERGTSSDRKDVSKADFTYALLAIDWGHSVDEVAERLYRVSAREKKTPAYARTTAENAAAAVAARGRRNPAP